jgi:hypothetical protein
MKKGGNDEIGIRLGQRCRNQMGDFEEMIDVRFSGHSLPFLTGVLLGGEV